MGSITDHISDLEKWGELPNQKTSEISKEEVIYQWEKIYSKFLYNIESLRDKCKDKFTFEIYEEDSDLRIDSLVCDVRDIKNSDV